MALLGAGEFEAWHGPVDAWLRSRVGGDGPVLIAPTAAAAEGDDVFASWAAKGLDHYGRLGIPAQVLPLKTREDASRDDVVALLEDASAIFFSGGNPWYLSKVLAGTPFWQRMCEWVEAGDLGYAGCSAGVACLTEVTYDSDADDFDRVFQRGLGYVRDVLFAPHWDIIDTWVEGARAAITASIAPGGTLVGIDERTAMAGDGSAWRVEGVAGVYVYRDANWVDHAVGDGFALELFAAASREGSSP